MLLVIFLNRHQKPVVLYIEALTWYPIQIIKYFYRTTFTFFYLLFIVFFSKWRRFFFVTIESMPKFYRRDYIHTRTDTDTRPLIHVSYYNTHYIWFTVFNAVWSFEVSLFFFFVWFDKNGTMMIQIRTLHYLRHLYLFTDILLSANEELKWMFNISLDTHSDCCMCL